MELTIATTTGVPIYQQIVEQVRAAAARGKIKPDERLASVRELSQQLVVNPNTVARAYTELEREGILYTRPGLGVFVAKRREPLAKRVRRERVGEQLDSLLVDAVALGFGAEELVDLVRERIKQFRWNEATSRETKAPAAT